MLGNRGFPEAWSCLRVCQASFLMTFAMGGVPHAGSQQCWRSWRWMVLWRPPRPSRANAQKRCPYHHTGLECKSKSKEIPGGAGKFGLGVQNEAGQKLTEFWQENTLVIENTLFQHTGEDSTHGHHQMVSTEIRLIIFFAAKDGEALYRQQKQDQELTVAGIMNSLLPNSDLNWRK